MFHFIVKEYPHAAASASYIDQLEKQLQITFPPILRQYYLEHNGAEIQECRFCLNGLDFCVVLIRALSFGSMPVEKVLKYNSRNKAIPECFIPLAQDEDEDDYYWDSTSGKVYYLSLENVERPIPICDSVEAFFEILNNC